MAKDVEFEFDIVVSLPRGTGDEDTIMDALFEAGCDDAVIGLGASGLVGLGFSRAGEDAEGVISAGVKQVLSAFPEGGSASRSEARSCEFGGRCLSPFSFASGAAKERHAPDD